MKQRRESEALRMIVGALVSCIKTHGPITEEWTGSAAKRVYKQLDSKRLQRDEDNRARFSFLMREFDNAEIRSNEIQAACHAALRGQDFDCLTMMRILGYTSRLAAQLTEARRGIRRLTRTVEVQHQFMRGELEPGQESRGG